MDESKCSYCQGNQSSFEVNGMRKFDDGTDFVPYRLCRECNAKLVSFNPRVEADKRRQFWRVVWKNVATLDHQQAI